MRLVKIRVIIVATVGVLLLSFLWWRGAGGRSVDRALANLRYEEAVAAVDRLYEQSSVAAAVPPELAVAGSDIRVTDEGVYLPTHRQFVTEDGLFILRRGSTFQPDRRGDPRFEKVRERLYRYHVSG